MVSGEKENARRVRQGCGSSSRPGGNGFAVSVPKEKEAAFSTASISHLLGGIVGSVSSGLFLGKVDSGKHLASLGGSGFPVCLLHAELLDLGVLF